MNFKTNIHALGILSLLCTCSNLLAQQPPKELPAKRTTQTVKIDGLINDGAWKDAAIMTDLIEFRPKVGAVENPETKTIAYLMYDDNGIYFGGFCYERTKDSIARELTARDGFGTNDYIGIIIDTYNDKINGFEYFVTPLGVQWDAKMSPQNNNNGGEDFTWSAVWKSEAVIHDNGWSFEMFIPYSAIRFGKKDVQDWGFNITRRRRKTEQQFTWNPIDVNVSGFLTQEGLWKGISNIKPPVRLQFSPYFSAYANHFPSNKPGTKNWTSQFNGGLDVKYGINQAFTLDATLIPDFGQVQSDNNVLNLTPFEVKFNENRNFFTEGTELFSKGDLFYSRRIGGSPIHKNSVYGMTGLDETVLINPTESKLINASKISGRTKNGLGIGFLNALTKAQYATIENTVTKEQREILTDPLTNYNLFVLDQSLKNNSSISFVNTNVLRNGSDYDANVSAALFNINDKKNTWNIGGKAAVSNQFGYEAKGKTKTGYNQRLYLGKISGRFNFNFNHELTDTKYSSNDLGYFTNNNYINHSVWFGYRWTQPRSFYNRININLNGNHSNLYSGIGNIDQKFQRAGMNFNANTQAKKLWQAGIFIGYDFHQNDFYEPRWTGKFFRRGSSMLKGVWYQSNNAKKYSMYGEVFRRDYFKFYNLEATDYFLRQTYRFSDRLSLSYTISFNPRKNSIGYALPNRQNTPAPIPYLFARRDVKTVENILNVKYSFNNKQGITFRMRHYNSSVKNKQFFDLLDNGKLSPNATFNPSNLKWDQNANYFNIDMVYTWQFAPGSFINVVWKDAVYDFNNIVEKNYFKNFDRTLEADDNNNISFKIIYFLDYLQLKRKRKS